MGLPFVGEIRMFGGSFAPAGWAFCDGSLRAISEYDTLFTLIGTTYGGDGQQTFALPDLRSRVPMHQGQGPGLSSYTLGEKAGVEQVTLTVNQLPSHSHVPQSNANAGSLTSPAGKVWAKSPAGQFSPGIAANANATMHPSAMAPAGGNQPHENMMPFLCISFIIALEGVFPAQ